MNPQDSFWGRYAPHLVLLVVGGLLLLGSQATALSEQLAFTVAAEPLALATEPDVGVSVPTSVATAPPAPLPTIDPRQFPARADNGLAPNLNPATYQGKLPQIPLQYYVVERNDTPNAIAFEYGINAETLLGCNPQLGVESSLLGIGVELIHLSRGMGSCMMWCLGKPWSKSPTNMQFPLLTSSPLPATI